MTTGIETADAVDGIGDEAKLTAEEMAEIKAEASDIQSVQHNVWGARVDSLTTRLCRWSGQSADGRKHASANDDEPVRPFEGACDNRVRLADMLTSEDVELCFVAAMRARIRVAGTDSGDSDRAGKIEILLKWVLNNQVGFAYVQELLRWLNFIHGDSPALGMFYTVWRRQESLEMREVTPESMMQMWAQRETQAQMQMGGVRTEEELQAAYQASAQEFMQALQAQDDYADAVIAQSLRSYFPHLSEKRALKVVVELRKVGRAQFPVPYVKFDGPEMRAKRFFEDFYLPMNTRDYPSARMVFMPEWMSRTEILERAREEGWSEKFVEGVLGKPTADGKREHGQEGVATFKEYHSRSEDGALVERSGGDFRGLYQVMRVLMRRVNDDGITGVYMATLHLNVNEPAHKWRLMDARGDYPGHVMAREVLTPRLVDSRGVPEVSGSEQELMKLLLDSFGDHAQLAGVPPLKGYGMDTEGDLVIAPLKWLPMRKANSSVEWMAPPEYPRTVVEFMRQLRRHVNEFHGRPGGPGEEVPDLLVQMKREFKVFWFLANLREVYRSLLNLCQLYMSDEVVARVTNARGEVLFRSREEIQGNYDVDLAFDPRDLDIEYLKTTVEFLMQLVQTLDQSKTIDTGPLVKLVLWRAMPEVAGEAIRDVQTATASEVDGEMRSLTEILAGREPPLPDDGSINYATRLQMYDEFNAMNPAAFQRYPEDAQKILQSRLDRMKVLSEQYGVNRQIGRQGGKAALGG
jgi:hypothetical protein